VQAKQSQDTAPGVRVIGWPVGEALKHEGYKKRRKARTGGFASGKNIVKDQVWTE
jgi:hypothetical protein